MHKNILVIDDIKDQAEGLAKGLKKLMPECSFFSSYEEEDIINSIENKFYSIAIVDIRMDNYSFNGIDLVEKILTVNPFANVIIVSAFKDEYFAQFKKLLYTGRIIDIQDKEDLDIWLPKLQNTISLYFNKIDSDPSEINKALLSFYINSKDETDSYKKGVLFEHFLSLLFQSVGFKQVIKRTIDQSKNEVDLMIRNDIEDNFIYKFGKYILVECKNKPNERVGKNDFIIFNTKLQNTNGLSELGILATTGYIAKTTYLEALRTSGDIRKIIFLSNPEIEKLINAENKLAEFKKIIDMQVKDN